MSYKDKTIKEIIDDINSGKVYLPAIQRKYVWDEKQILKLLDSILLNYPIGTFLFWNVKGEIVNTKSYSMYEFIKNYHQRDAYINPHAPNPITKENIIAVLDGQQRLTSLFIALQGSLAMKLPKKRWNNDDAFPQKELYLNLKSKKDSVDDEVTYEFAFLSDDDANKQTDNVLWYKVKNILTYKSSVDVQIELINKNGWNDNEYISKNLHELHRSLVNEKIINYFEIEKDSIDEVLDIFIRVNSGGTVLSKSDLLFSTIVSHWDNAREEIESLLKRINKIGDGFRFNNDFIMRTCVYLLDMPVTLKVETFKKDSVMKIKDNWEDIKASIIAIVELLNEFGFNFENIISYVAITPMIYYKFKGGQLDSNSKEELKKYIVVAQVKQIFGTASNSALTSIRDILSNKYNDFKLLYLTGIRFTGDRNLRFTNDDLDSLFDLDIGAYTFMILSLLYPNFKYSQNGFHQDHMHPHTSFNDKKIEYLKLSEDKKIEWQEKRNKLANIQLLEGRENSSKNDTPLEQWLQIPTNKANVKYLPSNISYNLDNFDEFFNKRQELMKQQLETILM